jgi:predicted kinase
MDLLARGLPTHANVVFSRYLLQTGDLEGLRLFPLFLATRATVRVKTSLAARALASDAERMRELTTRARQYLQLAEELLTPTPPRLIAIGGYSGVGKSTLARELAPLVGVPPGAVVLRTDELRRRRFAAWSGTMPQWAYAVEMRRKVYSELREQALRVLRTGYAVVADGVFNELIERRALVQIAKRADVPFAGVWLDADRAILQQRLLARQEDISDATGVVLEQQMARPLRRLRWPVVNAGGAPEETLQATEHALTESITDGRRLIDHMRRAL